jgi:hypothetical protein
MDAVCGEDGANVQTDRPSHSPANVPTINIASTAIHVLRRLRI